MRDRILAWGIYDAAAARIAAIRSDANLSNAGKLAKIETELKGPLDHLKQARAKISKHHADAHAQRAVLRERVTTSDAYPEARLEEVRTWLRSLSQSERMKVMESKDGLIEQAIIGAPHYLSSLPEPLWSATVDAAIEARFPGSIDEIGLVESAYENAAASAQLALDDIRRASGLPADEFGALAA